MKGEEGLIEDGKMEEKPNNVLVARRLCVLNDKCEVTVQVMNVGPMPGPVFILGVILYEIILLTIIYIFISLIFISTLFALRFDNINSAACIVADLHAIRFEPNGNIYK